VTDDELRKRMQREMRTGGKAVRAATLAADKRTQDLQDQLAAVHAATEAAAEAAARRETALRDAAVRAAEAARQEIDTARAAVGIAREERDALKERVAELEQLARELEVQVRRHGQVGDLDAFLDGRGEPLTAVIELSVPREESISRLSLRAAEQGRADDNAESIAKRLAIYESETAPILDVYRERGVVDEIDGVGSLDEITERIVAALAARGITA
jgi:adenylate kinase family enzyme